MAETTAPPAETTTPPAADSKAPPAAATTTPPAAEEQDLDAAELKRELEKTRRQLGQAEARNRQFTEAQKKAEEDKLSAQELLEKKNKELETQLAERDRKSQEAALESAVIVHASKLGFADPGDAFRLMDVSAVEVDAAGKPTNLEKVLGDLLAEKPYMAAAGRPPTNAGTADLGGRRTPARPDMNTMIRRQLGR